MAQDSTKEEKSVAESKEEKSEKFEFFVEWDDIEPTENRCGYTNVDDKTFDVLTRGIKFFRSSDGTFEADDTLPLAMRAVDIDGGQSGGTPVYEHNVKYFVLKELLLESCVVWTPNRHDNVDGKKASIKPGSEVEIRIEQVHYNHRYISY